MSTKVTLGGDRLGAGKKMEVDLHSYNRSTHDLKTIRQTTVSAGTLVPIWQTVGLPGDTFDIRLEADVMTHPTIGPLFSSSKVEIHVFECPIRLYQADLQINSTEIGLKMNTVKLPQVKLTARSLDLTQNTDNQQINPSSIFKYMGISGLGHSRFEEDELALRYFNATAWLAYHDIYKNYYANKQEEIGAIVHNDLADSNATMLSMNIYSGGNTYVIEETIPDGINVTIASNATILLGFDGLDEEFNPGNIMLIEYQGIVPLQNYFDLTVEVSGQVITGISRGFTIRNIYGWTVQSDYSTDGEPKVTTFPLKNIDKMRMNIMRHVEEATPYIIDETSLTPYNLPLYGRFENGTSGRKIYSKETAQEGLLLKTYNNDLFNNFLNTEMIDGAGGINNITAIDTSEGRITINELTLAKKMFDMMNRTAVAGATYQDWMTAQYTDKRIRQADSPIYQGGLMKELVFQEVISNAESGDQPLGTLGGRGVLSKKGKGGYVTVKPSEHSVIIAIASITPRVVYSQGNEWFTNLKSMDDFHVPALDQIGFQDLVTDQMNAADTTISGGVPQFHSAGKQPAWINYMTDVNRSYGSFAIENDQMFMTQNRKYEIDSEGRIEDLTTYIDPKKFNYIFANTRRDAMNYWLQVGLDVKARRLMSAKLMPNL